MHRLVEENLYCEEISKLTIFTLESGRIGNESCINTNSLRILRLFWKLIKDRSALMISHDHIFQYKRSQRRHYF